MSSPATQVRSRVPRLAGAAVERARLTVVPRTQTVRTARVPFVTLVSLVLLAGVVGLLMFNTSMQQASFTITTLEGRAASLAAREQELAADLEELRDPQLLAAQARKQGMRTPPTLAFLGPDGSVTGVEQPARAADGERINPVPPAPPVEVAPPPVTVTEAPPEGVLPPEAVVPPEGVLPPEGASPDAATGVPPAAPADSAGTTGSQSQQPQQSQQRRPRNNRR